MNEEAINKIFENLDKDNSGYIDNDEFFEGLKTLFNFNDEHRSMVDDIFLFADGNGFFNSKDGKLNKKEFKKVVNKMPTSFENTKEAIATLMFNLVDTDENGTIEKNEFETYIKRVDKNMKSKEIKNLFQQLSSFGKKIEKKDFIEYFQNKK